jgi:hypothetical protein
MATGAAADGAGAGSRRAAPAGLVGRDDLLGQLGRAAAEAAAGRGGLVLLTGEAGIGKTALATAAAADAERRGARVAWGWGWQGEGAPAWWPWVQVLRSLTAADERLRRLAAELPWPARLLPDLPGAAPPPEAGELAPAARFRLLDELTSVVLAAAGERPLVVVLDDLQWADPPSLELLGFLARRLPGARVLVLGTWRELDQPPDDPRAPLLAGLAAAGMTVPIGALGDDEVARLVAGVLGGEPEPGLVADVRRRTGGNPFFVLQVTRLLAAGGPAGIPFGVAEAIRRRLARLTPACRDLLAAAAVAGPELSVALLARVSGQPAGVVRDLLSEAVRAQVVAAPPEPLAPYRFAHDLFREVLEDGLGAGDRARLHLRVAAALEAERAASGAVPPARLASHFAQAGTAGEGGAVRWAALAAAEATRRLAHEEAARAWARALEVLDGSARADPWRRSELLLELAAARRRAGDLPGSRRACLQAAELARAAGDARKLALAALGLHAVGTRSWPTVAHELVPVLEEAAAGLDDRDPPLRARVLAALARELAWNGLDVERAASLAAEAAATAERTGDRTILAAALLARHNAGWVPENAAERLATASRIAELAGGEDPELLAEAHLLAAADLLELADPRFRTELATFLRLTADLGQPRLRYAALTRRAMEALLAGRTGEAERLVAEAADLGREIGEPDAADVEHAQLWELRGLQGRRAELLERTRGLFPDGSPEARYYLATALLEQGDRAGAGTAAAPLLEATVPAAVPAGRTWLTAMTFAAGLAAALGAEAACRWLYDTLAPHAGGAVVIGAGIVFRGTVDHHLGVLAAALSEPAAARAHLELALAAHERLGARAWAGRSRRELERLGGGQDPALAAAGTAGAAEPGGAGGVFRRDGSLWTLGYAGQTVRMRDAQGLRDLAVLLAAPGRPVAAADLVAAAAGEDAVPAGLRLGADEVLDDRARAEVRARLLDLEAEIDEASRWHDPARAERAALERDALVAELAAATGLGGRARRLGDQSERARKTVTARIRDVLGRVERAHPPLGAHLRASVTTGTSCSYSPATPTAWDL